jgi:hypothetical protein
MAEPILQQEEPAPYAAIQGLVTLFYFLPGYLAVAWGIMVNPGQRWLKDLAVILAGATFHVNDSSYLYRKLMLMVLCLVRPKLKYSIYLCFTLG